MKCTICGISCFQKMLHRTNPIGDSNPKWMCIDCMTKKEPELAKNTREDKVPFDIEKAVRKTESNKR